MNIGIFTEAYFPQISGVTTVIDVMDRELRLLGHNVYIFTNYYPDYIDINPNIFRLPSVPFVFDKACRVGFFYSYKIMKQIKAMNLDIIHTHTEFSMGLFGRIVSKKLKIPMIHTYHTMYKDWVYNSIGNNPISFLTSNFIVEITKKHCNSCVSVIVPSEKVRKTLSEYGVKTNIITIPNGIKLEPFYLVNNKYDVLDNREKLRSEYGITKDDKVMLNIGRQSKEKNVESIIYALSELLKEQKNIKFVIIGDGPNIQNLKDLADKLNIKNNVLFLGKKQRFDIEKYYKLADIFITSSTFETQGLTVIEAMAAKIPVMVKNDEAFYGVVKDNVTGFIFEQDKDLADLLKRVINNKDLLSFVSKNAYDVIEKFSSNSFIKNIENLYKNFVKK